MSHWNHLHISVSCSYRIKAWSTEVSLKQDEMLTEGTWRRVAFFIFSKKGCKGQVTSDILYRLVQD